MTLKGALTLAAALAALGTAAAHAQTPALTYSLNTGESLGNPPFTLGWEFTVNSAIRVDGLGVFDDSLNGLVESHDVGLWDSMGNLLASSTVSAGTVDPLIANFRYVGVAPVTLGPGTYFVGATWLSGNDPNIFTGDSGTISTIPEITYVQAAFAGGSTLTDPTSVGGSPGYFGANLLTSAVPEPATWAMLILGLGAIGSAARRRREPGAVAA